MPFTKKNNKLDSSDYIFANFVQMERKRQNCSLTKFTEILGYNKTYLRDLEMGRRTFSMNVMEDIVSGLNVPFNFDLNIVDECILLLEKMFDYFIFCEEDKLNQCFDEFLKKETLYYYSFAYPYAMIIKVMKNSRQRCYQECFELFDDLENIFDLLQDKPKIIYLNFKAQILTRLFQYVDAETSLKKALSFCNPAEDSDELAFINYRFVEYFHFKGDFYTSLKFVEKTMLSFQKKFCMKRIVLLMLYQANNYSGLHLYSQAIQVFLEAIELAEKINFKDLILILQNDLAWTYLQIKDYEKCIYWTQERYKTQPIFSGSLYYIPYCYFMMKEDQLALLHTKESLNNQDLNDQHRLILKLIQAVLTQSNQVFELISILEENCEKQEEKDICLILYSLLIEVYERYNMFQEICRIYKKREELLFQQ